MSPEVTAVPVISDESAACGSCEDLYASQCISSGVEWRGVDHVEICMQANVSPVAWRGVDRVKTCM
jgi:hypothetical protein